FHLRALVHMNTNIFPFRILENIVFTLNLHQHPFYEWERGLWEIGRAGSLAADRLILTVRWISRRAIFLEGRALESSSFLHILSLQAFLGVSLFLRILRTQPRPASVVCLIRGCAAPVHCKTQHDAQGQHRCSFFHCPTSSHLRI